MTQINKIKCNVVMLPTGLQPRDGDICKFPNGTIGIYHETGRFDNYTPYYIYFISNDDMCKDNEWRLSEFDNSLIYVNKGEPSSNSYIPIVSTTDSSLKLPSIENDWINNIFIENINKIDSVFVDSNTKIVNTIISI